MSNPSKADRISELESRLKALDKIKQKKLDDELREKGRRNILAYEPLAKQEEFHRSSSLIRIAHGGNDSGKTTCGAVEAVWWATKTHPYKQWVNELPGPCNLMVLSVDYNQQKMPEAAQDKLQQWLPKEAIADEKYTRNGIADEISLKNHSRILFKSAAQERKSLQGGRFRAVWVDEECVPSPTYWNELITRVPAGERLYLWMTATPSLEGSPSWMEDHIYERANLPESNIRLWEMSMLDNHYLIDQAKQDIRDNLVGDEDEIAARLYGHRRKRGRVYDMFSREVHIVPPVRDAEIAEWPAVWRIIDPHDAKPISVLYAGADGRGNIILFDEMYDQGLVHQVAERMKRRSYLWEHKICKNIIDTSANTRSRTGEGKSILTEFRDCGISCSNAVKDVAGGISKVMSWLFYNTERRPKLYVCANCLKTIHEFVTYARNKEGEIIKRDDEFMDCVRYLACDRSVVPHVRSPGVAAENPGRSIHGMDTIDIRGSALATRKRRREEQLLGAGRR